MSIEFTPPQDPVQLAAACAEQLTSFDFEVDTATRTLIDGLEFSAESLGFLGTQYFIHANTAFAVPADYDNSGPVTYLHFSEGLLFEGTFASYSHISVGRIIGAGAVRAICLMFDRALVFPYFDTMPDTDLLHVPVLAVDSISASS